MKTTAAVLVELNHPLELVDLEIPVLKPGQVLVDVQASGVCHTQLLEARGHRGPDRFLPHCLGHEGSGIVLEVGPGVTKVKPGSRVILSWIKGGGADVPGSVYGWSGRNVNAGAITTFARQSVISENRLTVLPDDFDMHAAALLGCAIPTGMGVVLNTAQPRPGDSLVVFGLGGVGLCALMAAQLAGCTPITAVDPNQQKLELAKQLGATAVIDPSTVDAVEELRKLRPGGVDFAIEATGNPTVMRQALAAVRAQGGTAVIVGNAPHGRMLEIDPRELNQGKRLLGTWGGDNRPDVDYPRYIRLLCEGKLRVDALLGKKYRLTDVNLALDDLERGVVVRPLIDLMLA